MNDTHITYTSDDNAMGVYYGDTFQIIMHRYSDPSRIFMSRNAAVYLGKDDRNNIQRPLSIIKQGHVPEILRAERAEFEFVDVSKEVYDHLVTYTTRTHRIAGGLRANTSDGYVMPSDKVKNPDIVNEMYEESYRNYQTLLELGETPQIARGALGASAKLPPFVLGFNFLTLAESLFTQRIWDKGAQGNTVKVVRGMWELCHAVDPELWDTVKDYWGPEAITWKRVRMRLRDKNPELYRQLLDEYGKTKSMWDN